MKRNLRAYFDLVRIPNLFTAIADVLAGYLFVGGGWADWRGLLMLCCASCCLYGGGVALNDACDLDRDRRERPDRPIPSGRVSLRTAFIIATVLLLLGVFFALTESPRTGMIAGAILVSVVLYDVVLKTTWAGPGTMGVCRALNLALGMGSATHAFAAPDSWIPIAAIWIYITSVTYFARTETSTTHRTRLIVGTMGIGSGIASLSLLQFVHSAPQTSYLGVMLLLLATAAWQGWSALASGGDPITVQKSVGRFVVGLILVDTCIVWAARGPAVALLVTSMLAPSLILKRHYRVT